VKRSTLLITLLLFTAACSGNPNGWDTDAGDDGGGNPTDDGGGNPTDDGGNPTTDSSTTHDTGTSKDSGTPPVDSGPDVTTTTADNSDGYGAARQACIDEINKLRATESHAAYKLWDGPTVDTCVDEQATYDQSANSAHDAWINGVYPTCNGNAQDECLGYGTDSAAVVKCLDDMWDERLQSNCTGCYKCNGPKLTSAILNCQSTSTCDFYGNYGSECGHYVNMSADYFSMAACGFSTKGGSGGWAVQNFQ
jgi:hypothetical protein